MPSTVYKGDLAEVTFGKETALIFTYNAMGGLRFTTAHSATTQTSTITFSAATNGYFDSSSRLLYPKNMLVGATLRFVQPGNSGHGPYDWSDSNQAYTITANDHTSITVTPNVGQSGSTVAVSGDQIIIGPFGVPAIDPTNTSFANGTTSKLTKESVLTDQFIGIAGSVTLPETKVDMKRYHVVGVGRDVAIQAPGKFTNEGGSMQLMLNNPRWLYYCLGKVASVPSAYYGAPSGAYMSTIEGDTAAGQTYLTIEHATSGLRPAGSASALAAGDYVYITAEEGTNGAKLVPVHQHREDDLSYAATNDLYFGYQADGILANVTPTAPHGDATLRSEIRRIVAIDASLKILHLESPLDFPHYDNDVIHFLRYADNTGPVDSTKNSTSAPTAGATSFNCDSNATTVFKPGTQVYGSTTASDATRIGRLSAVASTTLTFASGEPIANTFGTGDIFAAWSPHITDNKYLADGVNHLIFSRDTVPSFCIETSVRNRESGSYSQEDGANEPGTTNDAKTLTRVFRGCKVTQWSLSADTDAALKLGVELNAALCYTDTGRLESTAGNRGDRLVAHRMFENTANTEEARKESGIAKNSEKPYFFYNGTITLAGTTLAQVTNFTLTGSTGVEYHHVNSGAPVPITTGATGALSHVYSTEQVPFGGTRNASLAVEGKQSFEMSMEVIVDDPIFWHHMRTTELFNNTIGSNANGIVMHFTKQGTSGIVGHNSRESMTIVIDDFTIIEAPLPIPEDKGVLRSTLKILPQHVRVLSQDAFYTY